MEAAIVVMLIVAVVLLLAFLSGEKAPMERSPYVPDRDGAESPPDAAASIVDQHRIELARRIPDADERQLWIVRVRTQLKVTVHSHEESLLREAVRLYDGQRDRARLLAANAISTRGALDRLLKQARQDFPHASELRLYEKVYESWRVDNERR